MSSRMISITGDLGSGKSTVARQLAAIFNAELVSTGAIQRRLAEQMGMDTLSLNRYAETHREIDDMIDQAVVEIARGGKSVIFDSRMAWHFVPASFKICIEVDREIAAARLVRDASRGRERYSTIEEAFRYLSERRSSEHERFRTLYSVDDEDPENFDLIVNSSLVSPEAVIGLIQRLVEQRDQGTLSERIWLPPALMAPTQAPELWAGDRPAGTGTAGPVTVVRHDRCYFILEGHARVSQALRSQEPLIPVRVVGSAERERTGSSDPVDFLFRNLKGDWVQAWETLHGFRFWSYRCMEPFWKAS